MAYRISRTDPEYETAMREAKALFEAAMAKGAAKRGGRPPAVKVADAVVAIDAVEVVDVDVEDEVEDMTVAQPAAAEAAPVATKAAPKTAKTAKVASKAATKSAAKTAAKSPAKGRTAAAEPGPAFRRRPRQTVEQG